MSFDLDQLKRDNGRCLYYNALAFAVPLPSGTLALERPDGSYHAFVSTNDKQLRNLPRKHLVQVWETTIGGRSVTLGSQFVPPPGWTLKAQREIEEGEGV